MNAVTRILKRIRPLLGAALVAILIYWTALFFAQRSMLFPNGIANARLAERVERGVVPGAGIPGLQRHWLETDDGRTEYWLRIATDATAASPAGLVVFAHGNAELIDGQAWVFEGCARLGLSVAMCEYRGYGRSTGAPSQADITADHVEMMNALRARPEIDADRIIYFGRSIGTGVVCSLANELAPNALVLLSPFQSMSEMAKGYFAPGFLVRDPFDNEQALRSFPGPVLLMHGSRDRVIPIAHSHTLQRAAPLAGFIELDSGHNDVPVETKAFWSSIEQFVRELD